jgi:hypothetical protein
VSPPSGPRPETAPAHLPPGDGPPRQQPALAPGADAGFDPRCEGQAADLPDPEPAGTRPAGSLSGLLGRGRAGRRRPGRRLVPPAGPAPPLRPQQRLLLLDTWQRSGLPAGDFAALVGLS